MRAVLVEGKGPSGALVVTEVPDPVPRPGEVVIAVAAAGVNRADVLQRMGRYPSPDGWPAWPGLECAGTIAAVGEGVAAWSVGDAVCALVGAGAYSELVACPADLLLPAPASLSAVEAGAVMEAACTVWSALTLADAKPGELLLVHGGSGGIGTFAIQLATALGLRVIATARGAQRAAACAALGAIEAIDYTADDFVAHVAVHGGADVIIDVVGAAYLERNIAALAPGGRLVAIGLQGGARAQLDLGALLARRASIIGTTLRSRPHHERAALVAAVGTHVWPLLGGAVTPVVADTFALAEAAQAHVALESGAVFGKLVLVP